MKKYQLLLLFIFINEISYSQNLFPLYNAQWTEIHITGEGQDRDSTYYSYTTTGDTIIDNIKRSKIYFTPNIDNKYTELTGFIHTEGEKVIFRKNNDGSIYPFCFADQQDYVLYDFSLSAGDSISSCLSNDFSKVLSIDTVSIGGVDRKQFLIDQGAGAYWIEGIGSTKGLLFPVELIPTCSCYRELVCFKQNSDVVYINPKYSECPADNPMSLSKVAILPMNIYPNPMNNSCTITSSHPLRRIQIYNTQGMMLLNEKCPNEPYYMLYRQSLTPGTYYVRVETTEGNITNGKLIIK